MTITATFTGESLVPYQFYVFPDGTVFYSVPAVYILCKANLLGLWEPLYVGEAQDLKQRLNTGVSGHHGYQRAKLLGMTHIAAIHAPRDAERMSIETDLRHGLKPPCNAQDNALAGFLFR